MFFERNKTALQIVAFILLIRLVIPPVIRAWNWKEGKAVCVGGIAVIDVLIAHSDEFKLFELATDMSRNHTNFYQWLGIEVYHWRANTIQHGE